MNFQDDKQVTSVTSVPCLWTPRVVPSTQPVEAAALQVCMDPADNQPPIGDAAEVDENPLSIPAFMDAIKRHSTEPCILDTWEVRERSIPTIHKLPVMSPT